MSITPRPPIPSLIPESAPFTPEQRTWLNGLFAGCSARRKSVTPLSPRAGRGAYGRLLDGRSGAADDDDGDAPWHDPAMPMAERMKLADGRPLPRRLMAAMAQQDCGQCGYNCKDYADALFAQIEERLNLCVPGGKETSRMLKKLYEELDKAPAACAGRRSHGRRSQRLPSRAPGRSRDNPVYATFLSRRRLNKPGSEKETWHVDIDLAGTDLDYVVGDSFGVFPANDPDLVDARARGARRAGGLSRSAAAPCARCSPTASRCRRRPTCCSSSFPISPAASGGKRRKRACGRRRSRWRCRNARRAGGLAQIPRHPAGPRSLHRSARSVAAARLFDLLVASMQSRTRRRSRSMRSATRSTNACGSASARPFSAAASRPATSQGLCAEGAAFRAARGSGEADHHDRARHRHCAVPRVPA